jgi:hypothetical protein
MTDTPASTKPLDDFFRALIRAHDFRMKRGAAEASRQFGPKEANDNERPN